MKMDCDSERIWKMVEKYTPKEKSQRRPESLNLMDNLYNCYIDTCQACQDKRFRSGVNLLQKLPAESARVSIVINLHSDEEGYSIMLGSNEQKEVFLPYEDNEIFSYLDAGEIPPVVLEIIEKTKYCHFYNGCLVCEVRNYRLIQNQAGSGQQFDSLYIHLRPSQETILRYVNEVCTDRVSSQEERFAVESKLLLATQPPLCLDPDIDVVCVQNRLHYNKRKFNTLSNRRYIKRQSQAIRARIHLHSEAKGPSSLLLHQFLAQQKERQHNIMKKVSLVNARRRKENIRVSCSITELTNEVLKYSKSYQSDVLSLLQHNESVSTSVPSVTTITTPTATPTKGRSPVDDLLTPKPRSSPDKQQPGVRVKPTQASPKIPPGGLTISLPRSLTRTMPSQVNVQKRPLEQTKTEQNPPKKAFVQHPPVPSVPFNRPHIPGKTTVTILSKGGVQLPIPTSSIPPKPKLHNPNILKTTLTPMGSMPKLKPLESHKLTPPIMPLIKPPPLAPSTIPLPVKQLKTPPTSGSVPAMPQLHKIQVPTSSSSSTSEKKN